MFSTFVLNNRWNHTALDEAKKFEHKEICDYLERWANDHPGYGQDNVKKRE